MCSAKQIFLYFFNQWVLFECTRIHMFFINLQLTHIKMLFCMSNLTSIRPSEYYFYNALCSFLTLESSRHGIKDRWHKGKAWKPKSHRLLLFIALFPFPWPQPKPSTPSWAIEYRKRNCHRMDSLVAPRVPKQSLAEARGRLSWHHQFSGDLGRFLPCSG